MILSQTNVVTFRPDGGSTFGLSDWNTIIKSSNTEFVTIGSFDGIHMTSGAKKSAFFGVKGTPRMFSYGERIAVTWVNTGTSPVSRYDFSPLISFTDTNEVEIAPQGQWYAYQGLPEGQQISPNSSRVMYHDIRIAKNRRGSLTPLSAGIHSSITVCPGSSSPSIVCARIDIVAADTTPIAPPTNLTVAVVSPTKIILKWRSQAVGSELKRNNIYLNSQRYITTSLDSQIIAYLTPSKTCTLSVNSEDTIGNISINNPTVICTTPAYNFRSDLINPFEDIEYMGAFRTPAITPGPSSWDYALTGLAVKTGGDTTNADGGQNSSLFGFGHSYQKMIAEYSVPVPSVSKNLTDLPRATSIGGFRNMLSPTTPQLGWFMPEMDFIPDNTSPGGGHLLLVSTDWYFFGAPKNHISMASPIQSNPDPKGVWMVGEAGAQPSYYSQSGYLFGVPQAWADTFSGGRNLLIGGNRPGPYPAGPSLHSITLDLSNPPSDSASLPYTTLLEYYPNITSQGGSVHPMDVNSYGDTWRDGGLIQYGGKTAIVFGGDKGYGCSWYGYRDGTLFGDVIGDVPENLPGSEKAALSEFFYQTFAFYDPEDLGKVARGEMLPYEPQPYAAISVQGNMNMDTNGLHKSMAGIAIDNEHGIIYSAEAQVDGAKPVMHMWKIKKPGTSQSPNQQFIRKSDTKKLIKLNQTKSNLLIHGTSENVTLSVFSLNGKLLKHYRYKRGEPVVMNTSNLGSESVIIKVLEKGCSSKVFRAFIH